MALRNPSFSWLGNSYPNNVYDIKNRSIKESADGQTVNVEVFLTTYTDATRAHEIEREKPIYFILTGLPNNDTQLLKSLYEAELLSQHGDEIVDGTALSGFSQI